MAKSAKSSGSSGKGGSLFAGVVLGMVMGLAVAGGVAWYILKKNPNAFSDKEHHEVRQEVTPEPAPVAAQPPAAPDAASNVGATQQHFEFYKVLTDKSDSTVQPKAAQRPVPAARPEPVPAQTNETYYVQAGSFPNEGDAEKLKAKLTLLGLEASIQSANIPDKGLYHRVRLGPIRGSAELSRVMGLLKQNGVANATPIKTQ